MIVGMRTRAQAAKVAVLSGGARLPGKPKPDGTLGLSRYVDVGADFEAQRAVVESVSVLFDLYDGEVTGYPATGSPGEQVPSGWTVTAAKFEVDWPTDPELCALIRSHFGARRKAFNWGLSQVKTDLDARETILLMSRWVGIWPPCARRGTGPKKRSHRGGRKIPKSATRRGSLI
jgi:putative transposase